MADVSGDRPWYEELAPDLRRCRPGRGGVACRFAPSGHGRVAWVRGLACGRVAGGAYAASGRFVA